MLQFYSTVLFNQSIVELVRGLFSTILTLKEWPEVIFRYLVNIYTEIEGDDDEASSCCWKWWKAIRSFFDRRAVVGPVEFVLLLLRLVIPGDGAVANIVGL
jgi:hypothetical protein